MAKKPVKKKAVAAKSKPKKTTKKKKQTAKASPQKAAPKAKPKPSTAGRTRSASSREKVLQRIKQTLISQRESLLREAEQTLNTLPGDVNFPDMGDQATAETDRNFILRLRDRERMLLKKIDETIERIDSGPYGVCEECGNEIGIKRLEARPVTTLCIDCKTRQEEEERIAEGG